MFEVETPKDLLQHVGRELGPSDWMTVEIEGQDKPALVAETMGLSYT